MVSTLPTLMLNAPLDRFLGTLIKSQRFRVAISVVTQVVWHFHKTGIHRLPVHFILRPIVHSINIGTALPLGINVRRYRTAEVPNNFISLGQVAHITSTNQQRRLRLQACGVGSLGTLRLL